MVDLSAHHQSKVSAALQPAGRSFAKGLLIGAPISLVMWAAIIWGVVALLS
jgi:hypothetical protein